MKANGTEKTGKETAKEVKIHTFLTHRLPHLDEIFVYWMLPKFWAGKCRKSVKLHFWDPEDADKGKTLEEVSQDKGILICGIGGGEFDEHPTDGQAGKDGECAATLAAKKFGVHNLPELRKLLEYIAANDINGTGTQFDLASGLRTIYKSDPDQMTAIGWALKAFDGFYAEQAEFSQALQSFRVDANISEVFVGTKRLKIATISSDNETMARVSRYLECAVLVQQRSSGNVQIYTNKKAGVPPLDDVARILRLTEQEIKGKVITTDWIQLARDGKIEGAEEWYYFRKGNMILNGSLTSDNTPTRIMLEKITDAVIIALDPKRFEKSHFHQCEKGLCVACYQSPCPWYDFGLERCRDIRRAAKRNNK